MFTNTNPLDNFVRRELTNPAWHHLRGVKQSDISSLRMALDNAYLQYVHTKTDKDGMIIVAKGYSGLLADEHEYDGDSFRGTLETRDARDVKAWECAGPWVKDELSLFLKLWGEGFAPILAAVDKHGLGVTLSTVLVADQSNADPASMAFANSTLVALISEEANLWRRSGEETLRRVGMAAEKRAQRLQEFQRKGVKTRQEQAANGDQLRRIAAQFKCENPRAKVDEVAEHTRQEWAKEGPAKKLLEVSTVKRLMSGYDKEASVLRAAMGANPST